MQNSRKTKRMMMMLQDRSILRKVILLVIFLTGLLFLHLHLFPEQDMHVLTHTGNIEAQKFLVEEKALESQAEEEVEEERSDDSKGIQEQQEGEEQNPLALYAQTAGLTEQQYCFQKTRRRDKPGQGGAPVQYIHIPKAGGTTVQLALLRWTKELGIPNYKHNGGHGTNWTCPGAVDRGLLFGHRGFGFCHKMLSKFREKAVFVVSIREPVSHFRSFFDFTMNELLRGKPEEAKLWKNKKLSDLVEEYNHTLSLNLPPDDERMIGPIKFLHMAKQQTAFMCGWDCVDFDHFGVSNEVLLERALENLERTDVVVIMERLNDMIEQMKYQTTWIPLFRHRFPMENVVSKSKKSTLSKAAVEIVKKWTKMDAVLYDRAKQRAHELTYIARKCVARHWKRLPGHPL